MIHQCICVIVSTTDQDFGTNHLMATAGYVQKVFPSTMRAQKYHPAENDSDHDEWDSKRLPRVISSFWHELSIYRRVEVLYIGPWSNKDFDRKCENCNRFELAIDPSISSPARHRDRSKIACPDYVSDSLAFAPATSSRVTRRSLSLLPLCSFALGISLEQYPEQLFQQLFERHHGE